MARLVAGLLASAQGKGVVFFGESQAGYRLPQGLDLSVAPITRPQTWSLLQSAIPETLKLIGRVGGRRAWSRVDPVLFAEHPVGKEALAHVRHMAHAFGHAAEPIPPRSLGPGRSGMVLRDAVLLHRATLEGNLDRWLDQQPVRRLPPDEAMAVHPDGSATLETADERMDVGQTVLADDRAMIQFLPPTLWPSLLLRRVASTILTQPTSPLAAAVMHRVDTGMMLHQQAGGILAVGPGAIDPFAAALDLQLGPERAYRQAGQSSYETVVTGDGAPAVGRVQGTGPDIIAGFGATGAFLAPAIARWLTGSASRAESDWFGARLVDRTPTASPVADFGGAG